MIDITPGDVAKALRRFRAGQRPPLCRHYFGRGNWAMCIDPRKQRGVCRESDGIPACVGWPKLAEEER